MQKVSVVMASCNPDANMLKDSINSVLLQSHKNFEFIIVDDGSDNNIEEIVRSISNDTRIAVYRINNSGLGAALNYGIGKSSGKYIARLDDDDMMLPERLQKQVEYMEAHPDVSCVGTWHYDKYRNKCYPHRKFPTDHEGIVFHLLQSRFSLAHTTLMFRRNAFEKIGGYRIPRGGQDLDLELQLGTVGRLANLPDYLSIYTMSASGLGTINPQKYAAYLFALLDVEKRGLYPEHSDLIHKSINKLNKIDNSYMKNLREKWKRRLLIMRVQLFGKKLSKLKLREE